MTSKDKTIKLEELAATLLGHTIADTISTAIDTEASPELRSQLASLTVRTVELTESGEGALEVPIRVVSRPEEPHHVVRAVDAWGRD